MTTVVGMTPEDRHARFVTSNTATAHAALKSKVDEGLRLAFRMRSDGMHAVCTICERSIAKLTQWRGDDVQTGFTYTLSELSTLLFAHYMAVPHESLGSIS